MNAHAPESMVEHALRYARRGLRVFPCDPATKQPLVPRDKGTDGKPIPKTGGLTKATTDPATITGWWSRYPQAMIGVRMGGGIFALDPDMPKAPSDPNGMEAWQTLADAHGYRAFTHTHLTPRGGRHILFRVPDGIEITNSPGALPAGIDVRGEGGYIIAPPSRMTDGRSYRIEEPEHEFEFDEPPAWLINLLRKPEPKPAPEEPQQKPRQQRATGSASQRTSRIYDNDIPDAYVARAVEEECASVATAPRGQRNKALNRAAFNLGTLVGANRLDPGEATRRLLDAARASGLVADDGEQATLATIESGLTSGAMRPREMPERRGRSGAPRQNREERRGASDDDIEGDAIAGLPVIKIRNGEVPRAVEETEAAILAAGAPIYGRGGNLVRPVIEEVPAASGRNTTIARFRPLCAASVADHAARLACFQRYDGRAKDWVTINPPAEVMSALLAREGEWSLPQVAGITTTPTLRPDGSILSQPGYDPATRLFLALDRSLRMPELPESPTRADAQRELRRLEELLTSFPFVGEIDRAVALSGLLTAVVRGAMPVAPLHAIRASTPGTGKSYLVDLFSAVATGRRCPVIAAGKTEEETEKRLGALLRDAIPVVSIDNVNGELGGDTLCQMTERPLVRVRILGKSEAPEVECRAAVFATGNNLTLVGDMTRRTVLCTLDAGVERPELRRFDFNPLQQIMQDRGAYVAAVLTIVRAYRAAGSPEVCGPVGSYEDWTATVRAPLIWLGLTDPVASMEAAREEDPELSAIRELFGHWRETLHLSSGFTTNSIIKTATAKHPTSAFNPGTVEFINPEFRDLLLRQAGDGGAVNSRRLGKWLSKISGRVVDSYRLEMKADGSHGNRFTLRSTTESQPARQTEF